jgi:DNA-binding response OmpR family regulator
MSENDTDIAGGRILVVEDDPSAARFALIVLGERGGFDVVHVADPVIAVSRIKSESWDLVLADLNLPHMSGVALAEQAKRIRPELPVAVITAMVVGPEARASLLRYADEVLQKPMPPRELITAAAGLIGRARIAPRACTADNGPRRSR